MYTDFIRSDIFDVIDDCIQTTMAIDDTISFYPLGEYLLQTIFLKLTGYQEQKLKCIMWDLATYDLTLRYKYLNGKISIGECSSMEDKNKVILALMGILDSSGYPFLFPAKETVNGMLEETISKLTDRFDKSIFSKWLARDFARFKDFTRRVQVQDSGYFLSKTCFGSDTLLNEAYEKVFTHRNRCAHNLQSYQNNVPQLSDLAADKRGMDNYFTRILMLVLIDTFLVQVFTHYYKSVPRRSL